MARPGPAVIITSLLNSSCRVSTYESEMYCQMLGTIIHVLYGISNQTMRFKCEVATYVENLNG